VGEVAEGGVGDARVVGEAEGVEVGQQGDLKEAAQALARDVALGEVEVAQAA
jgi:hypothetical protein